MIKLLFFLLASTFGLAQDNFDKLFEAQRKRFEQFDKKMNELMQGFAPGMNNFGKGFIDQGNNDLVKNIETIENKDHVIVKIEIEDLKKSNLTVKVENGQINLSGTKERKEKLPGGGESVSSYMYSKSFPIPEKADETNHDMNIEKDTIVLKFKKTATKSVKPIRDSIKV